METLDLALRGRSIARFGDAELRPAVGTDCPAQKWNPRLREELGEIPGREGKDVVLVSCGNRDLGSFIREEAASVRYVRRTAENAYDEVDRLEAEVGRRRGPVILNAGAGATPLAWRMSLRGNLAFDLGYVGVFMPK
jgi:hypothetical protein